MGWINTQIEGVFVFEPRLFKDERGHFFESFNQQQFNEITGETIHFVQDNESLSKKGVIRGLHFQNPPYAQGKLVRVGQGSVLDVVVDLRKGSLTYGHSISIELSAENKKQLWVPPGFAHGFSALEENTVFLYKCTTYYEPSAERTLLYSDFNVNWKVSTPIVSEKDQLGETFATFNSPFSL